MDTDKLIERIERVSQIYAEKFGIKRDDAWFVLKLQEEMGELIQSYLMMSGQGRAKGKHADQIREEFYQEVADVLCHVLLLAHHNKIDLEKEINKKWLSWEK